MRRRPLAVAAAAVVLVAAAPAAAPGATRCEPVAFTPDVAVRVHVVTAQPACAVARTAADAAIAARFHWAVVSEGRWWRRGLSAGDGASWSARYHHHAITGDGTVRWTIRLRVVWR